MSARRLQRQRTKGWRMPDGAIYVGRPTRWGNPFVVGDRGVEIAASGTMDGPGAGFYDPADRRHFWVVLAHGLTAAQAVQLYEEALRGNLDDSDPYYDELRAAVVEWREAVQHQNDDVDTTAEYEMDPGLARVLAAEGALVRVAEVAS